MQRAMRAPESREEALLACLQARELLTAGVPHHAHRIVILLSDGIVESQHAREATVQAQKLCAEVPNVHLYAMGVGREVDAKTLRQLISECEQQQQAGMIVGEPGYPGINALNVEPSSAIEDGISPSSANAQIFQAVLHRFADFPLPRHIAPASRYLNLCTIGRRLLRLHHGGHTISV
ncbi:hypothetical protein CYMTET_37161 [Cymbomonas tetramitiformis]|uniref:VWFA domain-containing protein n=1 Tax=Cymbomonas tetramitiformis TaxID=36881 RepID=A0AAE0CEF8_9CHLO|nr:hypothetical protein CYMTET_37161 [Cymbomonas tetramitiformis]